MRVVNDAMDEVVGEPVGGREDLRRQALGVNGRRQEKRQDDRPLNEPGSRHDGPDCIPPAVRARMPR